MSAAFPRLDHLPALLEHFSRWYADGGQRDEKGDPLSRWTPQQVAVSPRHDFIAILSLLDDEEDRYQRLDLYDLAAHQFIAMHHHSTFDDLPLADIAFAAEPGHMRFVRDEGAPATTASLSVPGGYSLKRRAWILPSPAQTDTVPARATSAAALARHPWFAGLATEPVAFGGPWHDFEVFHHLQADPESGDFFAGIGHRDGESYVGRITAGNGALAWSAPVDDYLGFDRAGPWMVTDRGVVRAADGSVLCPFTQTPVLQSGQRQVHAAPDGSLWIEVDGDEAPGQFWRVDTATATVEERVLPYAPLLSHGDLWAGCVRPGDGAATTLHGLLPPTREGFGAPRWSTTLAAGICERMDVGSALHFSRTVGRHHIAGVKAGHWWALDLRSGAWSEGALNDEYATACGVDDERLYFTQRSADAEAGDARTVHWVAPATGQTGTLPLQASDWVTLVVAQGVVLAIENLGGPFGTRYVPAAYELATGERIWEGRHTRLCKRIACTAHGVAVGAMGQVYFFAAT